LGGAFVSTRRRPFVVVVSTGCTMMRLKMRSSPPRVSGCEQFSPTGGPSSPCGLRDKTISPRLPISHTRLEARIPAKGTPYSVHPCSQARRREPRRRRRHVNSTPSTDRPWASCESAVRAAHRRCGRTKQTNVRVCTSPPTLSPPGSPSARPGSQGRTRSQRALPILSASVNPVQQ
jgi:hypothetical protein